MVLLESLDLKELLAHCWSKESVVLLGSLVFLVPQETEVPPGLQDSDLRDLLERRVSKVFPVDLEPLVHPELKVNQA